MNDVAIGQRVHISGWLEGIENPEAEVVGQSDDMIAIHIDGEPPSRIVQVAAKWTEPV